MRLSATRLLFDTFFGKALTVMAITCFWGITNKAYASFQANNADGIAIQYNQTSDTEVCVYLNNVTVCKGNVVIPATVTQPGPLGRTYNVTSIYDRAFSDCSGMTGVVLPESIASIGERAFYGCTGLTSITIPGSVTSILSGAFMRCSNLREFVVSGQNTEFSTIDGVLVNKDKTLLIAYPSNKSATYTIPDGISAIGKEAFAWVSGLKVLTIPEGVVSIGESAFEWCSLPDITIPEGVVSIEKYAFAKNSELTSITIPRSVTSIGIYAFSGCKGLTNCIIPGSVTSIAQGAFAGCIKLESIIIPYGVAEIAYGTFDGCESLKDVSIPDGVTEIDHYAFRRCKLKEITIPASITLIRAAAFASCTSLDKVHSNNPVPPVIDATTFYNIAGDPSLYVPEGAFTAYYNNSAWRNSFKHFFTEAVSGISTLQSDNRIYVSGNALFITNAPADAIIRIYDIEGRVVETHSRTSLRNGAIDISHLSAGIYIVKIDNQTAKFIKT